MRNNFFSKNSKQKNTSVFSDTQKSLLPKELLIIKPKPELKEEEFNKPNSWFYNEQVNSDIDIKLTGIHPNKRQQVPESLKINYNIGLKTSAEGIKLLYDIFQETNINQIEHFKAWCKLNETKAKQKLLKEMIGNQEIPFKEVSMFSKAYCEVNRAYFEKTKNFIIDLADLENGSLDKSLEVLLRNYIADIRQYENEALNIFNYQKNFLLLALEAYHTELEAYHRELDKLCSNQATFTTKAVIKILLEILELTNWSTEHRKTNIRHIQSCLKNLENNFSYEIAKIDTSPIYRTDLIHLNVDFAPKNFPKATIRANFHITQADNGHCIEKEDLLNTINSCINDMIAIITENNWQRLRGYKKLYQNLKENSNNEVKDDNQETEFKMVSKKNNGRRSRNSSNSSGKQVYDKADISNNESLQENIYLVLADEPETVNEVEKMTSSQKMAS